MRSLLTIVFLAITLAGSPSNAVDGKLEVASLDFCSDQFVLAMLDRNEIVSLSRDATGVESFFREKAEGIPQNYANAEELLALKPTLIVRQWRGSSNMDQVLKSAGAETVALPFTFNVDDALNSMAAFGQTIGRKARAEAFVAKREKMRAELQTAPALNLKALYITPSGYTAGAGTEPINVMAAAGLNTMVEAYGLNSWAPLPLEKVVSSEKPDVIITSFFDLPRGRNNWSLSGHSFIQDMLADIPVIDLPARFMACNTLFSIDAAHHLRQEAERIKAASAGN